MFLPLAIAIPTIGIGLIGASALQAISRQPEATQKIQLNMILAIAFAEGLGILGFVLSLLYMNKI